MAVTLWRELIRKLDYCVDELWREWKFGFFSCEVAREVFSRSIACRCPFRDFGRWVCSVLFVVNTALFFYFEFKPLLTQYILVFGLVASVR